MPEYAAFFYTTGEKSGLAIYDLRSREHVLDVSRKETNAMVTAHTLSPDGKALVLALEDKNLKDRFLVQIDLHVNPLGD